MEKVIFDSNFLLEKRMKCFFAKQEQLGKFANLAEIIIPDMVIGELSERYKRDFSKEKDKFTKTLLANILIHNVHDIDIDSSVQELMNRETIEYKIIELKDTNALYKMKKMALKKEPPFVSRDGSDKGFKDSYIYFTVLEYLQTIEDKYVFFVTDDKLLKFAFNENPNVIVIENYDNFKQQSITTLYDDYFIERLKSEYQLNITKENIIDYWININENHVLVIHVDDEKYIVEVDSGEIINLGKVDDYSEAIVHLVNSENFNATHVAIEQLVQHIHFLSDNEIVKILEATKDNRQIYGPLVDDDVKEFISTLYDNKKGILDPELATRVEARLTRAKSIMEEVDSNE